MKKLLILLIFCSSFVAVAQKRDAQLEKIGFYSTVKRTLKDSILVNQLIQISEDSLIVNSEKSLNIATIAADLSTDIGYKLGNIKSNYIAAKANVKLSNLDQALSIAQQVNRESERYQFMHQQIVSQALIGSIYIYQEQYDLASEQYLKSIELAEKHEPQQAANSYKNLGLVYIRIGNYRRAKEHLLTARSISLKHNYKEPLPGIYNNLGIVSKNLNEFDKAVNYYNDGLAVAKELEAKEYQPDLLQNLSNVLFILGRPEEGMKYFEKSVTFAEQTKSYRNLASDYHNLSYNLIEVGKLNEALTASNKALDYADSINSHELRSFIFVAQSDIHERLGLHKDATTAMKYAYFYQDSSNFQAMNSALIFAENKLAEDKRKLQDSLKHVQFDNIQKKNTIISNQRVQARENILWILLIILVIVGIASFFLFKLYRQVDSKNKIVESQHREITDSINYAKRIQSAMISNDSWKHIGTDHFIFFKPKELVSGDFHWAHYNSETKKAIWAVADCTGHGVPGAFMSMLGISFLNEIIIEQKMTNPGKILDLLRKKVVESLQQSGSDQPKDGMDISLCAWDQASNTLEFAGANNGIWIIRKNEHILKSEFKRVTPLEQHSYSLCEVSPNKMPIGAFTGNQQSFTTQTIQLQPNDQIIAFSDGYADQFGGVKNKKFKSKPLKELLLTIHQEKQPTVGALSKHLSEWKGNNEQVDDICIVGVNIG